ncbi:MAG: hypothetical protein NZR01_12975 [Bryobacteraceae bacterium]|nr:hypothetical protein [Bryobacteraceae bacterium]
MRKSTGRQQEGLRQAYLHKAPGAGCCVRIDFGVVDRLAAEALRGLSALPRRGMEVGGLLLGRVEQADGEALVVIEDAVGFPCEHLYGPNFQLSPRDRETFAEMVASWAPGPGRPVHLVGFYRSHTRGDLELTPEDIELLDTWLPHPHGVFLLLRPHATRPAEAAFFFREDGAFRAGPPAVRFPFRRRELGGGAPPRRQASGGSGQEENRPGPGAPAAPLETRTHSPAPQAAPSRAAGGWLLVLALLAFLLVGVVIGVQVAGLIHQPSRAPESGDPFALGLSAVQVGSEIHLRWNPQAPALSACKSASLVIRDGPTTRMIDLRREDVARGALVYRHSSHNVSFRMEAILSPGNSVAESIELRLMPPEGSPGAEGADPLK